jgi:hypothetical protein
MDRPDPLGEAEFRKSLDEALYGEVVFSGRIPWADLTEALDAVAAASRPVPQPLIDRAWAVFRRHAAA